MTNITGGKVMMRKLCGAMALTAALMVGGSALAAEKSGDAPAQHAETVRDSQHPARFFTGFFTATIDAVNHAARSTSDTVHHNSGNVMETVAKARGFVRDTVSGVLGNARKLTGMVGDVMPFTEHHHYEAGAGKQADADNRNANGKGASAAE